MFSGYQKKNVVELFFGKRRQLASLNQPHHRFSIKRHLARRQLNGNDVVFFSDGFKEFSKTENRSHLLIRDPFVNQIVFEHLPLKLNGIEYSFGWDAIYHFDE
jgi:hypothetical protein